ncbi:hypothetical protein CYY_009933 [Polysphondylium violaceum]|uniref:Right handed beta helix domain-containing protein n=1 Tax=Polysphondylium violaceum TaxID=133409 RepID=A0A8J4V2H2_9MYCE|nr:hypothetical protein CYY_009933 [Polysphondylium violaceum]
MLSINVNRSPVLGGDIFRLSMLPLGTYKGSKNKNILIQEPIEIRWGGVYIKETDSILKNIVFLQNKASMGAAVYSQYNSLSFTNVSFVNNSASVTGGALPIP